MVLRVNLAGEGGGGIGHRQQDIRKKGNHRK